jgi:hypothetical protein
MKTPRPRNKVHARLNHGLSSRVVIAARAADATKLALAIIGETPPTPGVREAAEGIAEAIFALHDIRRVRQEYLSIGAPPAGDTSNAGGERDLEGPDALTVNLCVVLEAMNEMRAQLRRLDDYERKIRSRYKKLLRRLDYASIESLRHQR